MWTVDVVQLITRSIKIYCSLRWGVFGFIPFELIPQLLEILQFPLGFRFNEVS
jgi:uncharacterized membrane protein YuzA (DUF378 family)